MYKLHVGEVYFRFFGGIIYATVKNKHNFALKCKSPTPPPPLPQKREKSLKHLNNVQEGKYHFGFGKGN